MGERALVYLCWFVRDEEKTGVDLLVDNQSTKIALLNALHPVETLVPSIPEVSCIINLQTVPW